MPFTRTGLTEFTYSRYLVPWLCDFKGQAAFLDADVLIRGDISELFAAAPPHTAVNVVKNDLRFEWPSVMIFNCDKCQMLTPEYCKEQPVNTLSWAREEIGELPKDWNYLVGYEAECGKPDNPKLVHFTGGIPCFPETNKSPYADEWHQELQSCCSTVSWETIMGKSVHRKAVERLNAQVAK